YPLFNQNKNKLGAMMQFNFPKIDLKIEGLEATCLPRMVKIRQKYDSQKIDDVKAWVNQQMELNLKNPEIYLGKRLAITVGSRGIPDLDIIVRAIIDKLKSWGALPFIVPAMGSHGGATADGQRQLIATYNITEESMGVPILSSMEVVQIGALADGTLVYCDKIAYESDGIIILNKVKPHTDFRGDHESGLAKMMAIGLGNHKGASWFHTKGFASFSELIPKVCQVFLQKAKIAFGVGIVQNAYDHISEIEIMEKNLILTKDAALLKVAKSKIANFKFSNIDVLVIDEIGKNISGNGHDPNITGRSNSPGFENVIDIQKMFIRSLNEETHHNGCGLAMADITTRRCLNSVDFETTWINVITATRLKGGAIPMYAENDREALLLAIRTSTGGDFSPNNLKLVRIKDTLHMHEIEVSEGYLPTIAHNPEIDILSKPYEIEFDESGFML
ncbi:MAG: lactate racemase domain-containing protein, partial [Candidatus Adiutrix sp.]